MVISTSHFLQQFYIGNLLPLPLKQAVKMHLKALTSNLFTQCGYIDWNKNWASSRLAFWKEQ